MTNTPDTKSPEAPAVASVHPEDILIPTIAVATFGAMVLKVGLMMTLLQNLSVGVGGTL